MNYDMTLKYIEDKNKLGSVPGLVNVKELLSRLHNPQNKIKCLHIAGTNGKGSVFSFVQEILIKAGYKVGRYISPTIFDYRERFQINKTYISKERLAEVMTKVSLQVEEMTKNGNPGPTAFEIETAAAFEFFYQENVDFALIECGMGGRLDATNVIDIPILTVIGSISMDHMQFLGNTIEDITREKTGIIKPGCTCVAYPFDISIRNMVEQVCDELKARYISADITQIEKLKYNLDRTEFSYKGESYTITLLGEHQVYNAITAIDAAMSIDGVKIEHIRDGLAATTWSGRMTKVADEPLMYVDGAHNQDAWYNLYKTVNKYFTKKRIIYIIGVLKDKEYHKMVDILGDSMSYAITVTPDTPRGLSKEELAQVIKDKGIPVETAETSERAIQRAKEIAKRDDVIMVCGSLSFISEYLMYE